MNKKTLFTTFLLSLLLIFAFLISGCSQPKICFEKNCFNIEIVDTNEARMKGLMFREHLPENEGMLFIFQEKKVYSFWMKNTLIPLDMIWMNEQFEIVRIIEAGPCTQDPCPSYNPEAEALYVLEINRGLSEKLGLKEGMQATLK